MWSPSGMPRDTWSHPEGDPGRTAWVDVEPVRRPPRSRWRVELPEPVRLLASAQAVVVEVAGEDDDARAVVLDPDSGAQRWEVGRLARALALRGDTLLVEDADGTGRALDLAGGETLWAAPGRVLLALEDGLLVAQHEGVAWLTQSDPRTPPEAFPVWSARGMASQLSWIASQTLLVSTGRTGAVALRREDGRKAWDRRHARGRGLADHQVVLEAITDAGRETLFMADEGDIAAQLLRRRPLALAPQALIAHDVAEGSLVRCPRDGGPIVTLLPHWSVDEQRRRLAAAQDVVYAAGIVELQALGPTGELLWTLPPEAFPETFEPVPAAGRLYVLQNDGVACLEEG